jgi:hypothetical protein
LGACANARSTLITAQWDLLYCLGSLPVGRTTSTQITDVLASSNDAETYSFAWQASEFEVDLSSENFAALDALLRPYVEARQEITRPLTGSDPTVPSDDDFSASQGWAHAQGIDVLARGDVPPA